MNKKIINILFFLQFILIHITDIYQFSNDVTKHISLLILIIGYFINPQNNTTNHSNHKIK